MSIFSLCSGPIVFLLFVTWIFAIIFIFYILIKSYLKEGGKNETTGEREEDRID